MKGILIDTKNREVREVEHKDDYKEIYEFLGCRCFDSVYLDDVNCIYVDDEGLLTMDQDTIFFKVEGYSQPIAGNGLILGVGEEGESTSPTVSVEEIREKITFHDVNEVYMMI